MLLEVAESEISERIGVGRDTGGQRFVIGALRVVGSTAALLPDGGEGEIVEGARLAAGSKKLDRLIGETAAQLVPADQLSVGGRLPHLAKQVGGAHVRTP